MRAVFFAWLWLALSLFAVGCGSGGDAPPERMTAPAGGQEEEEAAQPDPYLLKLDGDLQTFYRAAGPDPSPGDLIAVSRRVLEDRARVISLRLNVDPPEVDVFASVEPGAPFAEAAAALGLRADRFPVLDGLRGGEAYGILVPLPLMREFARLPGLISAEVLPVDRPQRAPDDGGDPLD